MLIFNWVEGLHCSVELASLGSEKHLQNGPQFCCPRDNPVWNIQGFKESNAWIFLSKDMPARAPLNDKRVPVDREEKRGSRYGAIRVEEGSVVDDHG
jgi:hypothetical protein